MVKQPIASQSGGEGQAKECASVSNTGDILAVVVIEIRGVLSINLDIEGCLACSGGNGRDFFF